MRTICYIAFICLCVVLSEGKFSNITWYQTSKYSSDRLTPQKPLIWSTNNFPSRHTIKINATTHFQKLIGFGGAFTESSAYVWSKMNSSIQQEILDAYFGKNGHKYSIGRVHINSCDFSIEPYNFDNITGDYELKNFNISHDHEIMIPFIKKAMQTSSIPIKMYASPWSPPPWMKTNNNMEGSDSPCLIPDPKVHESWALYISKFITAYKEAGIPIWGLTPQNEPTSNGYWEVCVFFAYEMRDFIKKYLGPRMRKDHPDVKIIIVDDDKEWLITWTEIILNDPDAAQYVSGIGFHWYFQLEIFEVLDFVHSQFPNYFLLATEACNCPGVLIDDWDRGESYGYDIWGDLESWSVGWVDWNLVLDPQGGPNHGENWCDAQIIVDYHKQTIHYQPTYYYMGHYSRFIVPESVRVDSDTQSSEIVATAWLTPDNNVVLVVMNYKETKIDFKINDGKYYVAATIPPRSIQTYVYSCISC